MGKIIVQKQEKSGAGWKTCHETKKIKGVNFSVTLQEFEIFTVKVFRKGIGEFVQNFMARDTSWEELRGQRPLRKSLLIAKNDVLQAIEQDKRNGRLPDICEIVVTPMVAGLLFLERIIKLTHFRGAIENDVEVQLPKIHIGSYLYKLTIAKEGEGIEDIATRDFSGNYIE